MKPLIIVWANYLYEYNYNTYYEVMNMTPKELEQRFNEVTKTEVKKWKNIKKYYSTNGLKHTKF